MIATVEPFHGTKSAVYTRDAAGVWQRQQILDGYKDGLVGFRPNVNARLNTWHAQEWYWAT